MSLPLGRLRPRAPVNYLEVDDDGEFEDDGESRHDDEPDHDLAANSNTSADVDDAPDQAQNEQQFRLLNIPPELRIMIYKEALVDPNGQIVLKADFIVRTVYDRVIRTKSLTEGPHDHYAIERTKIQLSTNLLATCKQVYNEAILLVYHQPFVFHNSEAVHIFLANMRPTTINLLKDVTILQLRSRGVNNNALLSGLRHATGLTRLRLSDRVTRSDAHLSFSEKRMGAEVASRFYHDASYFIRNFTAVHGFDRLLKVVKFHKEDLRGSKSTRKVLDRYKARKKIIKYWIKSGLIKAAYSRLWACLELLMTSRPRHVKELYHHKSHTHTL